MNILFACLFGLPLVASFFYGLYSGRAWISPKGQRPRISWVRRHEEPIWYWGAMVVYVAAAGWVFFFTLFV